MNNRGFTLIELLAVVGLIGVLAILLLPNIINLFNSSQIKIMIQQENNVKDAAKIVAEDYCLNSIETSSAICTTLYTEKNTNKDSYICLKDMISEDYISPIKYKDSTCYGYTIFEKKNNGARVAKQTYLWCKNGSDSYTTVEDNKDAQGLPTGFNSDLCK